YHDLEKSTGVNVWTFAQNLAAGWFERGGEWSAVRSIVEILATSARVVIDDIRAVDARLGFLLDVAVSRALVVGEVALGGRPAERLRQVDAELIELYNATRDTIEQTTDEPVPERSSERFLDRPTLPFLRPDRATTGSGESAEVTAAIGKAITLARARVSPRAVL